MKGKPEREASVVEDETRSMGGRARSSNGTSHVDVNASGAVDVLFIAQI